MNNTETIASAKLCMTKKGEQYLVTTVSGQQVWVPKHQYESNAETITYAVRKAGDKYIISSGENKGKEAVLKTDQNSFEGFGKRSKDDILASLFKQGFTPAIAI